MGEDIMKAIAAYRDANELVKAKDAELADAQDRCSLLQDEAGQLYRARAEAEKELSQLVSAAGGPDVYTFRVRGA